MRRRTKVSSVIRLDNVTRITRRKIGSIFRAVVSLADLAEFLRKSFVQYAPKYQRGFRQDLIDVEEDRFKFLAPISYEELQIDPRRANEMAVKYLQGNLYTSMLTWNARRESGNGEPRYDEDTMTLLIDGILTIPDTAHRHRAYYNLVLWKNDAKLIPDQVVVNRVPVKKDEILRLIADFDPENEFVFVDVYNLEPIQEGFLYDEFNDDSKKPSTAVALDLNPVKTPSRRFMNRVMQESRILSRDEVETRRNTIGSKSRKLVTNASIEAAVRPMERELIRHEKTPKTYEDLVSFVCEFFEEFSSHYSAWRPNASAEERHALRSSSFALSNIMIHPLMRLAFEMWKGYQASGKNWRNDSAWRDAIARITGPAKAVEPKSKKEWRGALMDRENPDWIGKILITVYNKKDGKPQLSLSNTRQTREAAFQFLHEKSGLPKSASPKVR
jgi:hypothetical protein